MSNNNNNNNNNNATTSTSDITDEILLLSLLACFPSSFSTANHSSQEKGRSKSVSHIRHDSIDGVIFFQGTNKRMKIDSCHKQDSPSFYADLNDTGEPTPQDMARHNKFVEKRRQRTERHIVAHAEHLLSQAMQIEAELEAPQDHQDEFVAAINERSRRFRSARISERLILQ